MDDKLRLILVVGGCVALFLGLGLQFYALERYRMKDAPRRMWSFHPQHWGVQRNWFVSEQGYRLYRSAGWTISLGSLTMMVAWFL